MRVGAVLFARNQIDDRGSLSSIFTGIAVAMDTALDLSADER